VQDYIRSDNGAEFTAKLGRGWLGRLGPETLFIEPGGPWENGNNETFNGKHHRQVTQWRDLLYAKGGKDHD